MAIPRLLMIAGSGETAPRMAPVHRAFVARLASDLGRQPRAVLLDTPYGFQENAEHITERTTRFFRDRVGLQMDAVELPRAGDARQDDAATEAVRRADFVFAGPGSPSYALRHWEASGIAWALREKLGSGGALSFASAAAITMGAFAAPIYEIYKAGHEPHWLPGLDVLAAAGLRVALVPHYDNTEGAGHDTRYCYLGKRRFRILEQQLPADAWILGVDERTALIVDLDAGLAEVRGPGVVTIRRNGRERRLHPSGRFPVSQLAPSRAKRPAASLHVEPAPRGVESRIAEALEAGNVKSALGEILDLERAAETAEGTSEGTRHALRSAIIRLAELAGRGRSERRLADSVVTILLDVRSRARRAGDWATADEIRLALADVGVSVRDTEEGPAWEPEGELSRPSA